MRRVKVFVDSTADLSPELIKKYDITVMPLYVTIGGRTYRDMIDVSAGYIFECYGKTKLLPKTSAVSVSDYVEAFSKAVQSGYDVVHYAISSDFSTCYQNAGIAAQEVGHVYTVDSRNLSTGIAHLAITACELAEKGMPAGEIAEYTEKMTDRLNVSFILDKLEFLHKGGRCSGIAALGANVLKLKPCIEVTGGKMAVGKKYRGNYEKCAGEYIKDRLEGRNDIDTGRIFLTYAGVDEKLIKSLVKLIKKYQKFDEVIVTEAGSTISGHCGPGCFGILYLNRADGEQK